MTSHSNNNTKPGPLPSQESLNASSPVTSTALDRSASSSSQAQSQAKKHIVIIKLGTSSICDDSTFFPKLTQLSALAEDVLALRTAGHKVMIVSSGAVAMGIRRLGLKKRPKLNVQVQAAAAVGQGQLFSLYDDLFSRLGIPIAQVLYTKDSMAQRGQYLSLCNTLKELLKMDIVPIINENDSVCSQEIRFGDNDTLSAIAATMVQATNLFLLTDVDALYSDDPRINKNAKPLRIVEDIQKLRTEIVVRTGAGSSVGTGGMVTKLIAAEYATSVGCAMVIASGSQRNIVSKIMGEITNFESKETIHNISITKFNKDSKNMDKNVEFKCDCGCLNDINMKPKFNPNNGTHFIPKSKIYKDRELWILHGLHSHGKIFVDKGAVLALTHHNIAELLPVGITGIEGNFHAYQCVELYGPEHSPLGRGGTLESEAGIDDVYQPEQFKGVRYVLFGRAVVNHSSSEIQLIKGHRTKEIESLLGYSDGSFDCVAYRNNMAILTNRRISAVING